MTRLYALQLALPLVMIVWLALARRTAGWAWPCKAYVLLGYLLPASVAVRVGATVAAGDELGAVGNSGNTGEPHLHVHAQTPGPAGAPLGGDPLPILFNGRFPVRGDRIDAP